VMLFNLKCALPAFILVLLWQLFPRFSLVAAELDELRLFHVPAVEESDEQSQESSLPVELEETWVQLASQSVAAKKNVRNVYEYHGFIASDTGIQYLINGVPLLELTALTLLSVKRGGRLLELQTKQGQVFQLLIGESVERDAL